MKENTIKENINNNQINKFNLPTTWTKKKMVSLFLMTLAGVERVKAGQAFKNCFANEYNSTDAYDSLLKFDFASQPNITNGEILNVCCMGGNCSPCNYADNCYSCDSGEAAGCVKVNSLIFCRVISSCRGIVGDSPITTNATLGGGCAKKEVSLTPVANCLATLPASSLTGLDKGYAYYNPEGSSPCFGPLSSPYFICNWDNGGWSCVDFYNPVINDGCLLQWTASWPGPANKNPFSQNSSVTAFSNFPASTSGLTTSNGGYSPSFTATPLFDNNSYLTEKIAIPVGTVVGVAAIGGTTYLICKKRKKKNNSSQEPNNSSIELVETNREAEAHEIFEEVKDDINKEQTIAKQQQLENLIQQTKNKIGRKLELALETLLDTQSEITKGNDTYALRQTLRETKEKLQKKLNLEEINNLCQLKSEVVRLEMSQTQLYSSPVNQELKAQIQIPPK